MLNYNWYGYYRKACDVMDYRMNDSEIRKVLHENIQVWFEEDPSTLVVDELNVCNGGARADVSVINGHFYGFEIKSDLDTLLRLPNQIENYSRVFDYVSLVCSSKLLSDAKSVIPKWWGLYTVKLTTNGSELKRLRAPKLNKNLDKFSLAQFLLKDELADYLISRGYPKKITKSPKYKLWEEIAKSTSTIELSEYVRECLKKRKEKLID